MEGEQLPILGTFIVPHPPLIVPEVGGGEERKIQKTIDSYHKIAREPKGILDGLVQRTYLF